MAMSPRLLRPRASGFDPRSIANSVLWLNASDASSITLDGTAVTAWASRVGSASVTQSVTNNAPAYASSVAGLNNRPALLFDGTNDVLLNTATGLLATGSPAMTLIIAHRTGASLGTNCIFDIAQGSAYAGNGTIRRLLVSQAFGSPHAANAPYVAIGNRDASYANSVTSASTAYIHSLAVVGDANTSASNPLYYRNGANSVRALATGTAFTDGSISFTPQRFSVGSSSQGAAEFYTGHVAEVLLYSRVLSDSERLRIERYLGTKYGITVA